MKLVLMGSFLCLVLSQAGCGEKTFTVSGTVKFEGEPVADGNIAFVPDGGTGPGGGGPITNGQYKVQVPPGKAKVNITASKMITLPAGKKNMYGKSDEMQQYIPAKYNSATELREDITGAITKDFDLKK